MNKPTLPPIEHDELQFAGALLFDPDRVNAISKAKGLGVDAFTNDTARRVFGSVQRIIEAGTPCDAITVMTDSGIDLTTVQNLIDNCPSLEHCEYHADKILSAALKRHALATLKQADGPEGLRLACCKITANLPTVQTIAEQDSLTSLAEIPDPMPEANNPAALFRDGWLRKGGGAFLVSLAGQGKSTWTIQAATCWAMGKAAFGIEPVRPLNIAIVQAEDDAEEVAHFRNQIAEGLETEGGLDRCKIHTAMSEGVMLCDMTGATGAAFLDRLASLLKAHPEIDLLIINPFQSYFGGDVSRNAELTEFLRAGLDPIIKPSRVGVLFVHHTNKPPNAKERGGWGTDAFSAYIGAGGAELVNWARAMLALMPVENMPGVFRLIAGKRGQRLGWVDATGAKTNMRLIAHHDRLIYWREGTEAEAEALQSTGGKSERYGDATNDAEALAVQAQAKPWKMTNLRNHAGELFGNARGRRAFDHLRDNAGTFKLAIVAAKWKGTTFIGTRPEAEAEARALDTSKGRG